MFWICRALLQVKKYIFPLFYMVITISLNTSSTTCLAIRLKLIHSIFPQRVACMGKILVIRLEGEPASVENRVTIRKTGNGKGSRKGRPSSLESADKQAAKNNTKPGTPIAKRVSAKKAKTKEGKAQAKLNQEILEKPGRPNK